MSLKAFARQRDKNEPAVIAALRAVGATVQRLNDKGVPDLLVGWRGRNLLLEVKNRNARGKLTPDQSEWIASWKGFVTVVYDEVDAVQALGIHVNAIGLTAAVFSWCPMDECDGGDVGCHQVYHHKHGTFPIGGKP